MLVCPLGPWKMCSELGCLTAVTLLSTLAHIFNGVCTRSGSHVHMGVYGHCTFASLFQVSKCNPMRASVLRLGTSSGFSISHTFIELLLGKTNFWVVGWELLCLTCCVKKYDAGLTSLVSFPCFWWFNSGCKHCLIGFLWNSFHSLSFQGILPLTHWGCCPFGY